MNENKNKKMEYIIYVVFSVAICLQSTSRNSLAYIDLKIGLTALSYFEKALTSG